MHKKAAIGIVDIFELLLAICIVLGCNTVYFHSAQRNYHIQLLVCVILMCLLAACLYRCRVKKIIINKWIIFTVFWDAFVMIFYLISVRAGGKRYIYLYLVFLPIMVLVLCLENEAGRKYNVLKYFTWVMCTLSIISLLFWFIGTYKGFFSPNEGMLVNWGQERIYSGYFGLHFQIHWQSIKIFGISGLRNIGIFCEGPMFSLCLTAALGFELFIAEEQKNRPMPKESHNQKQRKLKTLNWKSIVLFLTNMTTFSVTGIILSLGMLYLRYLLNKEISDLKRLVKPLMTMLLGLSMIMAFNYLYGEKVSSPQWLTRLDDFSACFKAWKNAFWFGTGYGDLTTIQKNMSTFRRGNTGVSNGIMVILAQGGITFFLLHLLPLLKNIISSFKRNKRICTFWGVIIVEFIFTYFPYTFLLQLFLAYGYSEFLIKNTQEH